MTNMTRTSPLYSTLARTRGKMTLRMVMRTEGVKLIARLSRSVLTAPGCLNFSCKVRRVPIVSLNLISFCISKLNVDTFKMAQPAKPNSARTTMLTSKRITVSLICSFRDRSTVSS